MFISQHIIQVWGIVYLYSGPTTTFSQIDKQLHTFFFHNHIIGAGVYPNLSL